MSKHRVVKSDFWVDDYIEQLQVKERYFFLYLLTNPNTNILGIYQTTLKRMSFETGLEIHEIENILHKFGKSDKVQYISNHIIMVNFQRHQHPSGTMRAGIVKLLESLPKEVIDYILSKKSKVYDRLYRGYLIDYTYPYIDISKDKGINKDAKNPLKDVEGFLEKMPDYITSKYSQQQIKDTTESLIDYCKAHGKTYKDYYAALRNFLKKDFNGGKQEKTQSPYEYL